MKKIIKGGTLVNEYRQYKADIVINHGCIEAILPEGVTTEDAEIIPAEGCYVLPGVIDDQVHFREPGLTHKGNIAEGSRAHNQETFRRKARNRIPHFPCQLFLLFGSFKRQHQ